MDKQSAYDDDDGFNERVRMLDHDMSGRISPINNNNNNIKKSSNNFNFNNNNMNNNINNNINNNNNMNMNMNNNNNNNNNTNNNKNKSDARCWELSYYQPYFDIDTSSELLRIRRALLPFGNEPFFGPEDKPDLYGPFWIVATLGFLMAAMSNLSRYLFEKQTDPTQWNSDIRKISEAFSFLYGGLVVIPGVVFFVLRSWNENPSFIMLISLYGYSLASFVLTCIICILPFELTKWLSIFASCGLSVLFLTKNIYNPLSDQKKQNPGYYILGWLVVCQLILSFVLKFYFFKY